MKPRYTVIIFCLILASAVVSSLGSYGRAKQRIVEDMDQALQLTLAAKQDLWLTPDTIRDYRSHLHIGALRRVSFIGYDMAYSGLCTDARSRRINGREATYRSYAACSPLVVLSVSNQRLPALLWAAVLLWGAFAVHQFRRQRPLVAAVQLPSVGTLSYDARRDLFLGQCAEPVHLTPMQSQLMKLFFQADANRLSKQTICDCLWPKKPDASDTLYTLVRRLKPIVEQHSNLQIVSDRGKAYQLTVRESAG